MACPAFLGLFLASKALAFARGRRYVWIAPGAAGQLGHRAQRHMGLFLAWVALRSRSVCLPGLMHATLGLMNALMG